MVGACQGRVGVHAAQVPAIVPIPVHPDLPVQQVCRSHAFGHIKPAPSANGLCGSALAWPVAYSCSNCQANAQQVLAASRP